MSKNYNSNLIKQFILKNFPDLKNYAVEDFDFFPDGKIITDNDGDSILIYYDNIREKIVVVFSGGLTYIFTPVYSNLSCSIIVGYTREVGEINEGWSNFKWPFNEKV